MNPEYTVTFVSPAEFVLTGPSLKAWRDAQRVAVEGAQFSRQFKQGHWDGYAYPGTWLQGGLTLGRGMLEQVLKDLPCRIEGFEAVSLLRSSLWPGMRDYQDDTIYRICMQKWGRIALPTNAGKGAIIAVAASIATDADLKPLVLCDEISVFKALQEEIWKWTGQEVYTIEAGAKEPPATDRVVVAMVPTVYRRVKDRDKAWLAWLGGIGAVFLDEADKASAMSWLAVLGRLKNTHVRIGFSGTFFEEDTPEELTLREFVGPVLFRMRNADMIARNISAKPTVYLCPYDHQLPRHPPEWRTMTGPERRMWAFEIGVILNPERHRVVESLLEPDSPNVVVVNHIRHGEELAAVLPDARFLSGEDEKDVRTEVLIAFRAGVFQNLVVTKILDRGTNDLGHAVGLVFASGQGSNRQTLQRIGRGLRRTDGKRFLYLKDIIDRGVKYFDSASRKRVILYNAEEFDVRIEPPPNTPLQKQLFRA